MPEAEPCRAASVALPTADSSEGGKHLLINAAVGNGNLYIFRSQAGDKRWFKGAARTLHDVWDSFNVA